MRKLLFVLPLAVTMSTARGEAPRLPVGLPPPAPAPAAPAQPLPAVPAVEAAPSSPVPEAERTGPGDPAAEHAARVDALRRTNEALRAQLAEAQARLRAAAGPEAAAEADPAGSGPVTADRSALVQRLGEWLASRGAAGPLPAAGPAPRPDGHAPPGAAPPPHRPGPPAGAEAADAAARFSRAQALFAGGDADGAWTEASALLSRGDAPPGLRVFLGSVASARGDHGGAVRLLESALRRRPGSLEARRELALAYYGLGRKGGAIRVYQELLELDPEDGESMFNLAALMVMTKHPQRDVAIRLYRHALRLGEKPDEALERDLFR